MQHRRRATLLALVLAYLAFEIFVFDLLTSISTIDRLVTEAPMLTVSFVQVLVFFAVVWRVSPDEFRDALAVPTTREIAIAVGSLVGSVAIVVAYLTILTVANLPVSGSETDVPSMSGPTFAYFTVGTLFTIGLLEEYAFREILQRDLLNAVVDGATIRIGATSVAFAAIHLPFYGLSMEGAFGVGAIFIFSVVLGVLYERTGNLAVPILVHWWWDVFIVGLNAL